MLKTANDRRRADLIRKLANQLSQFLDPTAFDRDAPPGGQITIANISLVISDAIRSFHLDPAANISALDLVIKRFERRMKTLGRAARALNQARERETRMGAIADGMNDIRDGHVEHSKIRRLESQVRGLYLLHHEQQVDAFREAIIEVAHDYGVIRDKPKLVARRELKALPSPSKGE